jgi:hypothetical protein
LPNVEEKRLPRWPLWLALSLVVVLDAFLIVMLSVEGYAGNVPMLVNSIGLLVSCVLIWRGIPWSRWLLIALVVWRVAQIGVAIASYAPGDHRLGGSLMLVTLYVLVGLLVASPLGRLSMRAAT